MPTKRGRVQVLLVLKVFSDKGRKVKAIAYPAQIASVTRPQLPIYWVYAQ